MISMKKKFLLVGLSLQIGTVACAATPAAAKPSVVKRESAKAAPAPAPALPPLSDAERYALRCKPQGPHREHNPNGTMLWGTRRDWDTEKKVPETTSVLVSTALGPVRPADSEVKALQLQGGHLEASPAGKSAVGAVIPGSASDGTPVEVAICDAEPSRQDPDMVWYRIEVWNPTARTWDNPCVSDEGKPQARALAVGGVWDMSGARKDAPGRFTFACESGAISKCIRWGYKPWESRDGKAVAELHQACTRMVRADYCGDGHSFTHQDTAIDYYDRLGMSKRSTEKAPDWDPARGSFEAAWGPDGATCLSHTRDGLAVEAVLQTCPNRFRKVAGVDLGDGDRCDWQRVDVDAKGFAIRNMSYGVPPGAPPPPARKP